VVKLDSLEDVRQIIKIARKARTAVVIGGGITALELVEGLLRRKVKVHYFLRGGRYWGNVLDEKESRIVEKRLAHHGVQIHFNTEMEEIVGARNHVKGVRTKTGKVIACDMVAIAIGIRPRKELAEKSGLNVDRGVLVNEYLQTSSPDIFAAGDVAQVYDPFSGKSVLDSLWGPARDQGRTAGLNMTGERLAYHKVIPFNVTRLADLTTTIIGKVGGGDDRDLLGSAQDIPGIARGDSETWRQLPDAIAAQADFDVNRLRILIEDNQLIGAIVMGDQTLSHALQHIILEKMDISVIRENLIRPGAHIADSIARYWTEQQPV
jgi:NAD(P)H-nitrite reductase large subunit